MLDSREVFGRGKDYNAVTGLCNSEYTDYLIYNRDAILIRPI
jgi:hypothetical protein